MPQINFALSRDFAISGRIFTTLPRVALADSLTLGYKYAAPNGAFNQTRQLAK